MKLKICLQEKGIEREVGQIVGTTFEDATFEYYEEYIQNEGRPISISLPLEKGSFSAKETQNFFEGLLPEGFTRRTVAEWVHADERDYTKILSVLGNECLGAITVVDEEKDQGMQREGYEPLSLEQVKALAKEGASKSAELVTKAHLSLTGASGKVGLYYDENNDKWYLPIGKAPSTHIVKQSHVRLKGIVANEQLALLTAKKLGIDTIESFVVNTGSNQDSEVLLASKRYDRILQSNKSIEGLIVPYRLHQEDFAQAMGIASGDKYEYDKKGYMKLMFRLLRDVSANPLEDQLKLWDMISYNYFIGNTDAHIKNYSLIYAPDNNAKRLAPAYDLVSTICYESSTTNMAFAIAGEYDIRRITREHFEEATRETGLATKVLMARFDDLRRNLPEALENAAKELRTQGFEDVEKMKNTILAHLTQHKMDGKI